MSQLLEQGANHLIALDPISQKRLASLQGAIIQLNIKGPDLSLYLLIHSSEIEVMSGFEGDVDTVISGTPIDMLSMRHDSSALFTGKVDISGNIDIGKKFKRYMDTLNIDWEEHLSRLVGDSIAYQAIHLLKTFTASKAKNWQTLKQNVSEYLVEETHSLPPHSELTHLLDDIDEFRSMSDRLEQRITHLEKQPGKHS